MDMLLCVFVLLSIDITCAHLGHQVNDFLVAEINNNQENRETDRRLAPYNNEKENRETDRRLAPYNNEKENGEIDRQHDRFNNEEDPRQPSFSVKNNETTKNTSQTSPDSALPTNTLIYIGVGVLLAVVVIVQAICFFVYIRNVKATRQTIETIIRSNVTGRSDNCAVRYSRAPKSNTLRNCKADSLYEVIPEIDKEKKPPPPPPPPVETLPRKKLPPPPTIGPPKPLTTERIRVDSTASSTSVQSLRREKTIRSPIREPKPAINRPKLPLPTELPEKPSTLPKKLNDNSPRINHKIPSSMSIPRNDVDKNELMAKLKQRQALTEAKTNVQRSVSNASLPTKPASLPRRQKRMPPVPLPPKPHVRNDSDDSDDEWEMEQLKPINLYNI